MNIDAEIYLKQLFTFFNGNPEALISLIGDLNKESFYQKIKDTVYEKIKNDDEFLLTKKQMIDIIKDLWDEQIQRIKNTLPKLLIPFLKPILVYLV